MSLLCKDGTSLTLLISTVYERPQSNFSCLFLSFQGKECTSLTLLVFLVLFDTSLTLLVSIVPAGSSSYWWSIREGRQSTPHPFRHERMASLRPAPSCDPPRTGHLPAHPLSQCVHMLSSCTSWQKQIHLTCSL